MVSIISGPRNSGKSSRFIQLYQESGGTAVGVFSRKRIDATGEVDGYDLELLPCRRLYPLARLGAAHPLPDEGLTNQLTQGRFRFTPSAFEQAATYILSHPSSAVWIDEVGKLELRGLGHAPLLFQLIEKNIDLIVTIRDTYLPDFLSTYRIADFRIL